MVPIFTWNPLRRFTMLRLFGSEELEGWVMFSAQAMHPWLRQLEWTIEEIAQRIDLFLFRLSHIMKISNSARSFVSHPAKESWFGAWTTDSIRL